MKTYKNKVNLEAGISFYLSHTVPLTHAHNTFPKNKNHAEFTWSREQTHPCCKLKIYGLKRESTRQLDNHSGSAPKPSLAIDIGENTAPGD
jgi:hypothetical protein